MFGGAGWAWAWLSKHALFAIFVQLRPLRFEKVRPCFHIFCLLSGDLGESEASLDGKIDGFIGERRPFQRIGPGRGASVDGVKVMSDYIELVELNSGDTFTGGGSPARLHKLNGDVLIVLGAFSAMRRTMSAGVWMMS